VTPHTGTERRARLLREAAVRDIATMGESLTQQRRVRDDGLRVVNRFSVRRGRTVAQEEVSANYVPAAAVKRRRRALSGFTGCKARAGGLVSCA
jgi:hypothetical protein